MRYWFTKLIYYTRRYIPLYADDNSRIYSAYSAKILKQLSAPNISQKERETIFLYFSEHFIDDISGERLASALVELGEPQQWTEAFYKCAHKAGRPRATILIRKTATALNRSFNLKAIKKSPIDFHWSKEQEKKHAAYDTGKADVGTLNLNPVYWAYRLWKTIIRFKNSSPIGHAYRQNLLKQISDTTLNDKAWLYAFEKYAHLFNSPSDIEIMAEALTLREPARDLALLEFNYRVRYKKPKVLLFFRRTKLALAANKHHRLPDYRGTELTTIFFNPIETKRKEQQDKIAKERKEKRDKITKQRKDKQDKIAKKRKEKRDKIARQRKNKQDKVAKQRKEKRDKILRQSKNKQNKTAKQRKDTQIKRQREREKLKEVSKAKGEKRLQERIRAKEKLTETAQKRHKKSLKARARKSRRVQTATRLQRRLSNLGRTVPLWSYISQIIPNKILDPSTPAQLIVKTNENSEKEFQYTSLSKTLLKADNKLAIILVTGRFDPFLDISILDSFSKVIILNSTSLKNDDLEENVRDYIGEDILIECFSPSKKLIKPYTEDHKNISQFTDKLAQTLIEKAMTNRALSNYLINDLKDEYSVSLSDNIFRYIERFYATHLFFKNIALTTPVFFNSSQDKFQFSLARLGFSNLIILNGGKLLGEKRSWHSEYKNISPRLWLGGLKTSYKDIAIKVENIFSAYTNNKTKSVLIATHSRSSIHKLSAQKIDEALSRKYDVQTFDIASGAATTEETNNFYSVIQSVDRKFKATLQRAILPDIYNSLSSLDLKVGDPKDLTVDIAAIVSRIAGLLLGQTALFKEAKEYYAQMDTATAILVPGRYAEIRTLARAFHALGFPTIDLQLLFLSTMARYKAPITTHQAVIDSTAKDFYISHFNIPQKDIRIIGSIARDEDIKRAKKFGRRASLEHFKFANDRPVITLACQPGFETVTQEAARILAGYIKAGKAITVCIKLHPAQTIAQFQSLNDIFENTVTKEMSNHWRVIHKDPFWKLIPATDILISYFSNVCLQACAFNIPVLSLPGGAARPEPDFQQIGLARNVDTLGDLTSHLDRLLAMPKAKRQKEPPYSYIKNNPHMTDDEALKRLESYIADFLKD